MKTFSTKEDRVVRMGEVFVILGVPSSTCYSWISKGLLPKPLALGPRARGYRLSTLRSILASREEATA